ncbi:hypothetical protein [Kitasatospora sp. GP82]|uniref:hypothetical protein n=1 Tax=Kitasatospora sp. GP82 TaxID=3035089 RepID=UPI002474F24D|nr:hypothetical protein [Kitasatospora sp. GP82]MDH6126815.1 hypothetical protein [Kitasatospora sp. GP82]
MNLRALTRGDAAVAGAAFLLLIASFLPYRTSSFCSGAKGASCSSASVNGWTTALFPVLPSVFLLGIVAAALILLQRFQGQAAATRQVLGLRLDQWGIALSVAALWSGLWSLAGGAADTSGATFSTSTSSGFGAWLALLALLVLAGAAAGGPLVPALKAPLLPEKPATPQGYAPYQPLAATQPEHFGQPGQPGQPGQYGYPAPAPEHGGVPQGGVPQGGAAFGGQPQGGYGYPTPAAAQPQPEPAAAPAPTPAPPAADFAPFWFAVPVNRPLASKDNPAGPPVGELVPGTWYLAVEQRGAALVAQLPDGTHGLLNDTSGIQRG